MNERGLRLALLGATGLVGRTMLRVLEERDLPIELLRPLASSRSAGTVLRCQDRDWVVEEVGENSFKDIDIALFSAGAGLSREVAPIAAAAGAVVVDNSSAWRTDQNVPLVVPEVNGSTIDNHQGIIANPNCSTIQLVLPLKALDEAFGLSRVIISTYQSISGAGQKGVDQLEAELRGETPADPLFRKPAAFNAMFHDFPEGESDTEEEIKIVRETRRILGLPDLRINVTAVRIPTTGAHGESVNFELDRAASVDDLRTVIGSMEGVILLDDPQNDLYPTILSAEGRDEVFVGRIRRDQTVENGFTMWVVSDNLRKGAATNAVQIADVLAGKLLSQVDQI